MDIFRTDQVAVTDSGVKLFDTTIVEGVDYYGFVKNIGSEPVYVGNGDITADCGYQLDSDEELEFKQIDSNNEVNAICKSEESSNVCWFLSSYN